MITKWTHAAMFAVAIFSMERHARPGYDFEPVEQFCYQLVEELEHIRGSTPQD
jgi:hypothetical protein